MSKTNFDSYLEENLRDPDFAARFAEAGEAWDIALQLSALREEAGLSQKELADKLHTSQQHISRLESPAYQGHSLRQLRKVADALHARVRVVIEPVNQSAAPAIVKEAEEKYGANQETGAQKKPKGNAKHPRSSN
ncbi:MAG: helix-turn-helix transcriptional regulator [Nitrospirales bacterium]